MAAPAKATTTASSQPSTQDVGQHPNPIPNPHHRKIDLQSHADLTYLQQNLALAAHEKLDVYFPSVVPQSKSPKPAQPATIISLDGPRESLSKNNDTTMEKEEEMDIDPLRGPVAELVDEFLKETYTSAAHSITVNGIDASTLSASHFPTASNPRPDLNKDTQHIDPDHEVEGIHYTYAPFDRKLQKRMQALYEEVESLTAQVASLRREIPKNAAQTSLSMLQDSIAKDEEMWFIEQERLQSEKQTGLQLDDMRKGWNDDVRNMYNRGVSNLAVLNGAAATDPGSAQTASLTETVGKLERARNVAGEFE